MRIFEASQRELAPYLTEPLLTSARLRTLTDRAAGLPADVRKFLLECSLSPPASRCALLAQLQRARDPADACGAVTGIGSGTPAFVERWLVGRGGQQDSQLWVEIDEAARGVAPPPSVHIARCLSGAAGHVPHRAATQTALGRTAGDELLRELSTHALVSSCQAETLDRCLGRLPPGGYPFHVTCLAVPAGEVRFGAALPREAFESYISEVCGAPWRAMLQTLAPWAREELNGPILYCALSFNALQCRTVSLIYPEEQVHAGLDDAGRSKVRKGLVREGLCTLAQDAALTTWMASGPPIASDACQNLQRTLELCVSHTTTRLTSRAYLGVSAHS